MTDPADTATAAAPAEAPAGRGRGGRVPLCRAYGDVAFLCALVVLVVVRYVGELGFYSDDWFFLGHFRTTGGSSLWDFYRSLAHSIHGMRPGFIVYLGALYEAFGLDPLGYHLVNTAVFAGAIALLYLSLRELTLERPVALAVAAVYACLPHYSAVRFWVAASPIGLSLALYLLSLYADLRTARDGDRIRWGWKALALAGLLFSALAYELFLPLFVVNLFLMAWHRRGGAAPDWRERLALYGPNVLALAAAVAFKAATTTRLHDISPLSHARWLARFLWDSARVSFGEFGAGLPLRVVQVLVDHATTPLVALALGVGALVFAWFYRIAPDPQWGWPSRWLGLVAAGGLAFGVGYAVFLTNSIAQATATGIANRTASASALGVALVFVGVVGAASRYLPRGAWRRGGFAAGIALLCASNFLVVNALGALWAAAYGREVEVLGALRRQFPTLPPGSTLILDGVCPYVGPAIVFESNWDLAGALMAHYGDATLRADVATMHLTVRGDGLHTVLYGSLRSHYPYGEGLQVYHVGQRRAYPLPDVDAARAYFGRVRPELACPEGAEGRGAPVFE